MKSCLLSMLFITIFFYTYTGIIGTNYAILNILSFIFSVILAEYVSYLLVKSNYTCKENFSITILIFLLFFFVFFTYFPIKINLFKDPLNNNYGIQSKRDT